MNKGKGRKKGKHNVLTMGKGKPNINLIFRFNEHIREEKAKFNGERVFFFDFQHSKSSSKERAQSR